MKTTFLINRLRRMSVPEILYRVQRKLASELEKRNLVSGYSEDRPTGKEGKLFSGLPEIADSTGLIRLADSLCENKMDIFALKGFDIGTPIQYHKDYKSGKSAPADVFGKSIDYRDDAAIGDIKYIWELNRHLFLVPLALAYKITGDAKYLKKLEYYLSEWLEQNKFMRGVNWASSLELGIRLINWTLCWHLAGEAVNAGLKAQWLKSIYRHCWFIHRNYSLFSSANNHLIGEAAGMFIACCALPEFSKTAKWRKRAYGILVRESRKQNHGDGVNKEQALSYQQFVLDFLVAAGLSGKANSIEFPKEYWFVVEKMLVYLLTIKDASGNFPQTGDEDDGYVLELTQRDYGAYGSLLNTGAYLFGREDFLQADHQKDTKTSLLLNIGNSTIAREKWKSGRLPSQFEQGGYYLLGRNFGTAREEKLIFDCGPLGYLSLAAHGHADALSFVFSAGGSPIFIDPGTYAYHTQAKWRNYFRGTAAHNTATVDGKNQSDITGSFMWGRRANAQLLAYEDMRRAVGIHDGYLALKDKVMHRREIRFDEAASSWHLIDDFQCKGSHRVALYFQLDPHCRVKAEGNKAVIDFGKGTCSLVLDQGMQLTVHRGETDPISGWYSPSYDVLHETYVLKLEGMISGSMQINTAFKVDFRE